MHIELEILETLLMGLREFLQLGGEVGDVHSQNRKKGLLLGDIKNASQLLQQLETAKEGDLGGQDVVFENQLPLIPAGIDTTMGCLSGTKLKLLWDSFTIVLMPRFPSFSLWALNLTAGRLCQ